ncbi:MAG: hypothetical protein O3B37_04815 [Proteobacteria bacterium]|nr:hypothetical protein [Pseudomonadota bacterium]
MTATRTTARSFWLLGLTAVMLGTLAWPNTANAQIKDAVREGVQVGTPLPHDLTVPDQSNQVQSFVTLKKNRGLILIFSRSLSW